MSDTGDAARGQLILAEATAAGQRELQAPAAAGSEPHTVPDWGG